MLGDETWIKLFPGLFMRHDGVSSFFVSVYGIVYFCSCQTKFFLLYDDDMTNICVFQVKDTVQVDKNVSRHLPSELNNDDWNLLVSSFRLNFLRYVVISKQIP